MEAPFADGPASKPDLDAYDFSDRIGLMEKSME